ncbi:hypothetical protein [Streptococcus ovuberis]|uniref:Uncharacterized protein n=1 Tax=Streptococcus ovuberis TaxID=1936207 RepID=A0A7X6S147_9STRE|nr:hypothetical protein [Streptococcus ovuberis]NKZ20000.1 hypothetical protein [Streptococcus ovuberis]
MTGQAIVDEVGVGVKTIQRPVKEINHLPYVGIGVRGVGWLAACSMTNQRAGWCANKTDALSDDASAWPVYY